MGKKRVIKIIVMSIILLGGINSFLFLNKRGLSYSSISGKFIEEIPGPLSLNLSLILFILGWVVLLLLAFNAYRGFLKHKREEESKGAYQLVKHKKSRSETDLDVFYKILKEKKSLGIGTISKIFQISKEKALEWAKVLENHGIVTIEYPAFYDPEVKINEKEIKEKPKEKGQKIEGEKTLSKEKGKDEKETKRD